MLCQENMRQENASHASAYMGLFQTFLFEKHFQSRRLLLGTDVIGSFTMRDVFVAAPSVLSLSQRNLSLLSMNRKVLNEKS